MSGFESEGVRVRHEVWGTTGTVHEVASGVFEVAWDGSFVADELDLVREHLVVVAPASSPVPAVDPAKNLAAGTGLHNPSGESIRRSSMVGDEGRPAKGDERSYARLVRLVRHRPDLGSAAGVRAVWLLNVAAALDELGYDAWAGSVRVEARQLVASFERDIKQAVEAAVLDKHVVLRGGLYAKR